MPRRKKGKKVTVHKSSPAKSPPDGSKKINKDYMKNWLQEINAAKNDFQYDSEIEDINSDDEESEFECNLKELEVRTNTGKFAKAILLIFLNFSFQKPLKTLLQV